MAQNFMPFLVKVKEYQEGTTQALMKMTAQINDTVLDMTTTVMSHMLYNCQWTEKFFDSFADGLQIHKFFDGEGTTPEFYLGPEQPEDVYQMASQGVTLLDKRILLVPRSGANIWFFDVDNKQYVQGPPVPTPMVDAWVGGTLLANQEVVFTPGRESRLGIYNTLKDTFRYGRDFGAIDGIIARGCVLLGTGKVLFPGKDTNKLFVYDHVNDLLDIYERETFAEGIGGMLLTDGNALLLYPQPQNNVLGVIFNDRTKTFYDVYSPTPSYSVSIKDVDTLVFSSYNARGLREFDINTKEMTELDTSLSYDAVGTVRCPTGEISFIPYNIDDVNDFGVDMYNPKTKALRKIMCQGPGTTQTQGLFSGGGFCGTCAIFVPRNERRIGILDTHIKLINDFAVHPFLNHFH